MAPHLDDGGLDDADRGPATGGGGPEGARPEASSTSAGGRPAARNVARVAVRLPDVRLDLVTDRGVFAGARLDPGTETLLRRGELVVPDGPVLDLGCGYGPIALTLARRNPAAAIWAVDVNERARDLCLENVRATGLANVTVAAPDAVPADLRFAALWSNPPIRIGKGPLHELLLRWLGRLDTGRGRPPRRAQAPRLGLAGPLAGRAGLDDRAPRLPRRLPPPRRDPAVTG